MLCKQCNSDLMVAKNKLVSEVGSEDVFSELRLVCINPKCTNYAGNDLSNPKMIAETVRNKVN